MQDCDNVTCPRPMRHTEGNAMKRQWAGRRPSVSKLAETRGQLLYEWRHLKSKLRRRAPERYCSYRVLERPRPHPLFRIVPGKVRDWERRER